MKNRMIVFLFLILCLCVLLVPDPALCAETASDKMQTENYEKRMSDFHEKDLQLYAKGAVLMDAKTGRILYGKHANTKMSNASTTKILTCVMALEQSTPDAVVTISKAAAKMPEVKLHAAAGDEFLLGDLLYALMLESDNDVAVAIAEHLAGSVEAFAHQMNQKARDLGCRNTHFVTPNGLDAEDAGGVHETTALDLCKIMAYCIKNPEFLKIAQTDQLVIQNRSKTKTYHLYNHNALRTMMEGVIAGKTGFTGKAGYCYVGAYEKDARTYTFALLACGWPGNKGYKWKDSRQLIRYGNENYRIREVSWDDGTVKQRIPVRHAVQKTARGWCYPQYARLRLEKKKIAMLLRENEKISVRYDLPKYLETPQKKGTVIGSAKIYADGFQAFSVPVSLDETMNRFDLYWCFGQVLRLLW